MKRRAKVDYARWVFVLPALLVVGILLIYPIFSSLYYSMTTKHLIRLTYDFIGLENYKAVLADPNFFKAFLNSVLWTLGSLAGQLIMEYKTVRSFICSYDAITCILVISMCYLLYDYRKMGKGG